jgi:lysophospholipase L1-like esterase
MTLTKSILYQIFIIFTLIFILDFLFGSHFIPSQKDEARSYHKIFGINLKPNITKNYEFSNSDPSKASIEFCTDQNSFRILCNSLNKNFKDVEYDITFLGDSIVESTSVNHEDSFSGLIEKSYYQKISNMGVNGYGFTNSYTKINYFLNNGLKTKRTVMFITSVNDFNQYGNDYELDIQDIDNPKTLVINDYNKQAHNLKTKLRELFPLIYLSLWEVKTLFLGKEKFDIVEKNINNLNDINYENFDTNHKAFKILDKINDIMQNNDIKFYLVIFPNPGNYFLDNSKFIETMKDYCQTKHCKLINLFDSFFELTNTFEGSNSYKKLFLENDDHFNIVGHQLVAEMIIEQILSN